MIMILSLVFLSSQCSALRRVNPYTINAFQESAPELLKSRKIVINLDRRLDRINHFSSFLKSSSDDQAPSRKVGFSNNWCRHSGFDGNDTNAISNLMKTGHLLEKDFDYIYRMNRTKKKFFEITPGSVGCYKSHMEAMEIIAADNTVDFGVIAEDDVAQLSPDFDQQWDLLHQPETWKDTDMIYLQSCTKGWPKIDSKHVSEREKGKTNLKTLVTGSQIWCLAMYAITTDAARRLTQEGTEMYPIKITLDGKIPRLVRWLKTKLFSPPIAQAASISELGTDIQPMDFHRNNSATSAILACEAPPATKVLKK